MAPRDVHAGRWDYAMFALQKFVRLNQPQPLSPVWEAYVTGVWQPICQRCLQTRDDRGEQTLRIEWGVRSHPFNLTKEAAGLARAKDFIDTLKVLRRGQDLRESTEPVAQAWWPQNAADLLDAIKAERGDALYERAAAPALLSRSTQSLPTLDDCHQKELQFTTSTRDDDATKTGRHKRRRIE